MMLSTQVSKSKGTKRITDKPKKPQLSRDPGLKEVLDALDGLTDREVAETVKNKVAKSTIQSWRSGRTRRPQHMTMTLALRAVGKGFAIVSLN
jgi:hypothetical protein